MEKRVLAKLPRQEATVDLVNLARITADNFCLATASLVCDKKILQLHFYEVGKLRDGNTEAVLRTFISCDDYITQDLRTTRTKWLTASLDNMLDVFVSKWNRELHETELLIRFQSAEDERIVEDFLKPSDMDKRYRRTAVNFIRVFQMKVKKARLAQRHKKETDPIDKLMDTLKDIGPEFRKYVFDKIFAFARYGIYSNSEKKNSAYLECTHCKRTGLVNREEIRLRHNESGTCPFCGSQLVFKARGKMAAQINTNRIVGYVEPRSEGFVIRYFYAGRTVTKTVEKFKTPVNIREYMHETGRVFYKFNSLSNMPVTDAYEYAEYRQTGKTRWCHGDNRFFYEECHLYPGNLPEAWAHTPMKYSGIEYTARNIPTEAVRYPLIIQKYLAYPKLEWICKMGLNHLVKNVSEFETRYSVKKSVDLERDTIFAILGLDKIHTRILQEADGNLAQLLTLKAAFNYGVKINAELLQRYYNVFTNKVSAVTIAKNSKCSLHKILKYIETESNCYSMGNKRECRYYWSTPSQEDPRTVRLQNLASDWLDYIGWCTEMKYDLTDRAILLPKNFKAMHDRTHENYMAFKDAEAREKRERRLKQFIPRMQQIGAELEKIFEHRENGFCVSGSSLLVVLPSTPADLTAEGKTLHHCVGGYAERVADGVTTIFFIRKREEPEKPYYTLEIRNGNIVQCRGANNCNMTEEVKRFVNKFASKVKEKEVA